MLMRTASIIIIVINIIITADMAHPDCPGYSPYPNYSGNCDTQAEALDAASAYCAAWNANHPDTCGCFIGSVITGTSSGYAFYLGYENYPQCNIERITPGFGFSALCLDQQDGCCVSSSPNCRKKDPCAGNPQCDKTPANQCAAPLEKPVPASGDAAGFVGE